MTKLNESQEATLSELATLTERRKSIKDELRAEFERKVEQQTKALDHLRLQLVKNAVEQEIPKRRIGLAYGTKDHGTVVRTIEAAMGLTEEDAPETEETPSSGPPLAYAVQRADDDLEVNVTNWNGHTGKAEFTKFEGEWMADGDDELTLAVERALFGDEPDEELKRLVALPE